MAFLRGPESRLGLKTAPHRMSERSHRAYVQVMEEISQLVYWLRSFDELRPLLEAMNAAEEEYMPGYPPISPLTQSFFHTGPISTYATGRNARPWDPSA